MIKETTQLQGFPTMKLPKIKGTVEIRLHNPTTGKTVIERGENMITNAVKNIFATNYGGSMNYDVFLPLYSKMYGGILCFAQSLDTSSQGAADDYYIPDSTANSITAHAGQVVYTDQADDTTRGNPSSANMSIADGVATLSWEWGLPSGNGTISSLALTHTDIGSYGAWGDSAAFKTLKPLLVASFFSEFGEGVYTATFAQTDDYSYTFVFTAATTVVIYKRPVAAKKIKLVSKLLPTSTEYQTSNQFNTTVNRDYSAFCHDPDNHLLHFFSTGNGETSSITHDAIDYINNTITSNTITLSGATVRLGSHEGPFLLPLILHNGYVYLPSNLTNSSAQYSWASDEAYNKMYKVKLSNTADIQEVTVHNAPYVLSPTIVSGNIIVGDGYVIQNNNLYRTNTYNYTVARNNSYPHAVETRGLVTRVGAQRNANGNYGACVSKYYLGTKYNLSSAVQKTASQSMLITYTLQEVAPE